MKHASANSLAGQRIGERRWPRHSPARFPLLQRIGPAESADLSAYDRR
jgi:hypothetical protein